MITEKYNPRRKLNVTERELTNDVTNSAVAANNVKDVAVQCLQCVTHCSISTTDLYTVGANHSTPYQANDQPFHLKKSKGLRCTSDSGVADLFTSSSQATFTFSGRYSSCPALNSHSLSFSTLDSLPTPAERVLPISSTPKCLAGQNTTAKKCLVDELEASSDSTEMAYMNMLAGQNNPYLVSNTDISELFHKCDILQRKVENMQTFEEIEHLYSEYDEAANRHLFADRMPVGAAGHPLQLISPGQCKLMCLTW